ncbi:hypothetical protein A2872_04445 [Candidatus Gottesmanbacteria bacterium RIFCSPHIGHO2_01_FULL_42_12]|uniref:TNase-like domain-containing protein n=1 Tax=Candidatus Gottesmanbacteria bacterium RIFCSPHIGHO2_01_FULL_42_12 TaxID=1798377 RepID=A0A1F5Z146_9BACT|nr:MAG: hypothetical protein A2872_04445 [Candidatus Gottesmanbacteria bacterium RIFCSPHIGHO2_01_FULL_42_12]
MKKLFILIILISLIPIIYFSFKDAVKFTSGLNLTPQDAQLFLVKRVVDGDTIELDNGDKVRYIGVNTPETVDPRKPVECFGEEAKAKNKELVEWKLVRLEKDITDKDKYGRLLRYVYIQNTFVNDFLVRQGYANVATYPPDVKFVSQFLEAEKYARENKLGLWSKCR